MIGRRCRHGGAGGHEGAGGIGLKQWTQMEQLGVTGGEKTASEHYGIVAASMMASGDPLVRIARGQWRDRGALL
eukprot:SAG11_NODE_304_length_10999_cov_3.121376_5_plen_74_part_00